MDYHLLDAQAAVDWVRGQLPSFEQRLNLWTNDNLYLRLKETEPDVPNNILVIAHKEYFPLSFNVEAGAYINVLRSALDILANSLARRANIEEVNQGKFYFPICRDKLTFQKSDKWKKLKKALPVLEVRAIENLHPYKGGNAVLSSLHELDVVRKHRRTIFASATPTEFRISPYNPEDFTIPKVGPVENYDETILGLLKKGVSMPEIKFPGQVFFWETDFMVRKPVIKALNEFSNTVEKVIGLFDKH